MCNFHSAFHQSNEKKTQNLLVPAAPPLFLTQSFSLSILFPWILCKNTNCLFGHLVIAHSSVGNKLTIWFYGPSYKHSSVWTFILGLRFAVSSLFFFIVERLRQKCCLQWKEYMRPFHLQKRLRSCKEYAKFMSLCFYFVPYMFHISIEWSEYNIEVLAVCSLHSVSNFSLYHIIECTLFFSCKIVMSFLSNNFP